MSDLPSLLRTLARQVDVIKPIIPPPRLAPALLAAAEEIETQTARTKAARDDAARMRPIVEAARALQRALDQAES